MRNGFELIDGFPRIDKDPGAVLDYTLDWSDWLEVGETLLTASVTVSKGVAIDDSGIVGGNSVTLWVSGGRAGTMATVTVRVTTSSSPERVDERTLYFRIRNR